MKQRMTPVREKIVQLLERKHLLSAAEILHTLEKESSTVNKTTVYRALEFLLSSGKVCQHQFDAKEAVFELRDDHHDHLICTHCLKTERAECNIHLPEKLSGYTVQHHHLTVYGICSECQKKKNSVTSLQV